MTRDDSAEDQSHGSGISQTLSSPSPAEEMQVLERIFMERYSRINPSQGLGNCRGSSLLCEETLLLAGASQQDVLPGMRDIC